MVTTRCRIGFASVVAVMLVAAGLLLSTHVAAQSSSVTMSTGLTVAGIRQAPGTLRSAAIANAAYLPAALRNEVERLSSTDAEERARAVIQLGAIGPEAAPAAPFLLATLDAPAMSGGRFEGKSFYNLVRSALQKMGTAATPALADGLQYRNPNVRRMSAHLLSETRDTRAVQPLIAGTAAGDYHDQWDMAVILARFQDAESVGRIYGALKDRNPRVRAGVTLALSHMKDPQAKRHLLSMLDDPIPLVRSRAAAQTVGESKRAVPILLDLLNEKDADIRETAARSLGVVRDSRVVQPLIAALKDADYQVKRRAAYALGHQSDQRAIVPLISALKDPDHWVRSAAAASLRFHDKRAIAALKAALKDESPGVRQAAIDSLMLRSEQGSVPHKPLDPEAVNAVIPLLNDPSSHTRLSAARALAEIGDKSAVGILIKMLKDRTQDIREQAAFTLGRVKARGAVQPLIAALSTEGYYMRILAAGGLGNIGDSRAIKPLQAALQDPDPRVRETAAYALKKLEGAAM